MKVKDVIVHFELYDGGFPSEVWRGYIDYACALGEADLFPVHGKDLVLNQLNNRPFIKIADKIYNVKEIKSVSFGEETEREAQ